jgi:hypothetical protein
VWLGIGDDDIFDFGGILGAIIGVIILLPFVGIATRFLGAREAQGPGRTRRAAPPRRRTGLRPPPDGSQAWVGPGQV